MVIIMSLQANGNYVIENGSRANRIDNIAVAYMEIYDSFKGDYDEVTTTHIRRRIREKLGMPQLEGEQLFGDLKAHGDAIGGHGLCMETNRKKVNGKLARTVGLNSMNYNICREYLENELNERSESRILT